MRGKICNTDPIRGQCFAIVHENVAWQKVNKIRRTLKINITSNLHLKRLLNERKNNAATIFLIEKEIGNEMKMKRKGKKKKRNASTFTFRAHLNIEPKRGEKKAANT